MEDPRRRLDHKFQETEDHHNDRAFAGYVFGLIIATTLFCIIAAI